VSGLFGQSTTQLRVDNPSVDYPLGPGDEISVHVLDLDEISDKPTRIDLHGDLRLPLAGEFHAEGLTTRQLQDQIVARLKGILLNPVVTVSLAEFRDQPVTVMGAVNTPGVKQIRGSKTLMEAISDAGGLRADAGAIITITRSQSAGPIPLSSAKTGADSAYSVAEVEIYSLLHAQKPGENIPLRAHDVISVPPAEMIYILGEVLRPGGYEVKHSRTISILDAVALAGGTSPIAGSSHARVLRSAPGRSDRMEFVVDLNHMLAGKAQEFQLQPADILFIPTNKGKLITTRAIEAMIGTGGSIAVFRGSR
jgi:polysaccharide export outer membrane protein